MEGTAILITVVVVVMVTALNDYSKEQQFRSLQDRVDAEITATVRRGGETTRVAAPDLVVGDICQVYYGDLLSADGIIIYCNDLKVDESSLTGESDYVKKSINNDPLLLSGTYVMEGTGLMVVTAVGANSQAGVILSLLTGVSAPDFTDTEQHQSRTEAGPSELATAETQPAENVSTKSILQCKLELLALHIGYAGTVIAVLTILVLIIQFCIQKYVVSGEQWENSDAKELINDFILGVTILVVAVPEGLPLAVTIALAYSVKKMMKDKNLVRHLDACETMGNATVICSDKTGTLTTNRMTAMQVYLCGWVQDCRSSGPNAATDDIWRLIVDSVSINSAYTSYIEASERPGLLPKQVGNKTECALLGMIGDTYKEVRAQNPENSFFKVYTFNSSRKWMGTVVHINDGLRLFVKGAAEVVFDRCSFLYGKGGSIQMITAEMRDFIAEAVIAKMALGGLRTICLAHRDFVSRTPRLNETNLNYVINWDHEATVIHSLTCICIVGIEDPIRPEVPDAIRQCQEAGIKVYMVTGDNIDTAQSIALKCGIIQSHDGYLVLNGSEFNDRIKNANGEGIMESRINPAREVVAATGDGTNDGPALKKADVGLAMGLSGTGVAKEASDIIIMDDNFASIVKAVMWGRNVYDSISKFLQFQLTVNAVAIVITFFGACAVQDSPIKAVQMLWINMIMDTMASLALATELPTPDLLKRQPYGRGGQLLSRKMLRFIVGHALYQICVVLLLMMLGPEMLNLPMGIGLRKPTTHLTIVFNTFVMMTLFNEINARKIHGERNVFKGILSNPIFCMIWIGSFVCQVMIVQYGGVPLFTVPLSLREWCWCLLFGLGVLIWGQIVVSFPSNTFLRRKKIADYEDIRMEELSKTPPSILWMRSVKRVTTQLRVVKTLQQEMYHDAHSPSRLVRDSALPSYLRA